MIRDTLFTKYGELLLKGQMEGNAPDDILIKDSERDILFIPGLGGNGSELPPEILSALAAHGNVRFPGSLPRRNAVSLQNTASPKETAQIVTARIEELLKKSEGRALSFVAYSIGGAILEETMLSLSEETRRRIEKVVMIAPLHKEMRASSETLAAALYGNEVAHYGQNLAGPRAQAFLNLVEQEGFPIDFHTLNYEGSTDGVLPTSVQSPAAKDIPFPTRVFHHSNTHHLDPVLEASVMANILDLSLNH